MKGLCGRLLVCLLCSLGICSSTSVALASSSLKITRFTIETTRPRQVTEEFNGKTFTEFVNEPYAYTQAGGHPVALTSTIELEKEEVAGANAPVGGDPKDVLVDLPPGLLGDPMAAPRCVLSDFTRGGKCTASAQVGVAEVAFAESVLIEPIYNLEPEFGQSAEFGIPTGENINIVLTGHVIRSNGSYGLTVVSNGIPMRGSTRFTVTFWGTPADPVNDPQRGRRCETDEVKLERPTCPNSGLTKEGGEKAGVAEVPFLDMPANCALGPQSATIAVDSWQNPGHYVTGPPAVLPQATGCGALSFQPLIGVSPDTLLTDSPVGLGVSLRVPQPEEPGVPSTPQLRDAVVTLPPGLTISPGVVDGIQACDETGPEGLNLNGPESEQIGPNGEPQLAPGKCPDASTIGTAEAVTPLLPEPVKGHLYLARPLCGGANQSACVEQDALDGRLYRLYLELGGTGSLASAGVNIKAEGVVSANPATGQLTTTFKENPQLPFSELKLQLNGGPRASLANPQACGEARTTADFTPWSAPGRDPEGELVAGTPDANPFSFYVVGGCAQSPGLSPGFLAQTVRPQAGAFSPFTLTLTRKDGEQDLAGIQVHTPPGLLGMLSTVALCEEPAAAAGTCPESSRIGSTVVASGAGSHPFEIAGNVYLTKSYKGAPFGLSVVTHAVAGPFDLGLIVVRARIDVDQDTSTLTVTSDPLPQIIFGVPLRLQRVTVNIDRPGFMFNPTNCDSLQIGASVSGSENGVANVANPFAVSGCKNLKFGPALKVSTNGHTSRVQGASLDAKLTFPTTAQGSQANIARVKVSLPKQLPSRLSTLQKACPASVFNSNPVACPAGSVVGIARTSTPVLPVELEGPAYFVSHGGESFPSLVVVLQGDGVRVDVVGTTFISEKTNITSSTFKTVPDVPVSSFELYLPQGKNSALAANTNLCGTQMVTVERKVTKRVRGKLVHRTVKGKQRRQLSLSMPTEFVGQNGALIHTSTKISISGCPQKRASKGAGK